ncbi:MAG TPA: glycerol kinase GlpK [SAR86 cluster bacterium]|jgi:glycerol kinase|nr:glycerol kinase GlpK [SAR86 cluster bacterium]|tara:strand:+ start:438 stop:1895 length:1458 start_codon:yes stop_codon:yes gene_type:complete
MSKKIISIDQGTTSSRAVIFSDKGELIGFEQLEFKQFFPNDGWVEHDPEEIWLSVVRVLNLCIKRFNLSASDIASIGITNQRETVVIWDKKTGKPIYNAIVWQDRRTSDFCDSLKDSQDLIQLKTGLTIDPYFSASKVNWILDQVDGARQRAENGELLFGTIDSFLIWKLTEGRDHKTDVSNASRTMLYNIETNEWDEELLSLFKVPSNLLPTVCDNAYDFGYSELLGGKVSIGGVAGDQQSALIGQCCFEVGEVKSTYGTGCFMMINTGNEIIKSSNKLLSTIAYRLEGKTTYALEGSIFVAGSAIQWLRDGLNFFENASESEDLALKAKDNSRVVVVPALTGLGAPYWDADARGAIFGLTRDTGIPEITKAVIESVVYQTKDLLEAMKNDNASFNSLKIDGGMVANNWFSQELSNVLQVKVSRPKVIETTSLGAAYLAGLHAGVFDTLSSLKENWSIDKEFEPQKSKNGYLEWKEAVNKVLTD